VSLAAAVGLEPARYLGEVRERVVEVAGTERLGGLWLFGSAALGDFDPKRSDLDVQAVSDVRLPAADRRRLASALGHDALPCPARGLEFVLYARADLNDPAGPAFGLNLNTGARMEPRLELTPLAAERFWFVIDVAIGRERGRPLLGPPPGEVLPVPPRALLVEALNDALDWFAATHPTAPATLLGACRTWAWAHDGRWRSKVEAAAWARERLEDPEPLDRAERLRDGALEASLTEPEVASLVARARAALDA
jgi:hypothetical protein